MKLKFGAIVTDGRGKIGGQVLSKNRAGSYLRTKVTPVNPNTAAQATARNRLTTYSQGWRSLTDAQRSAWNNAVAMFAKTDIFGDKKNPSGFNLYVALNANLSLIGGGAIVAPPLNITVGSTTISSLTAAKGTPALSLTMSGTVPAGTYMVVKGTPAMSAGINFVKSQLRVFQKVAAAGTAIQDLLSTYQTKFGTIGAAGQKITIQVYFINSTTGVQSGRQMISAIIAA